MPPTSSRDPCRFHDLLATVQTEYALLWAEKAKLARENTSLHQTIRHLQARIKSFEISETLYFPVDESTTEEGNEWVPEDTTEHKESIEPISRHLSTSNESANEWVPREPSASTLIQLPASMEKRTALQASTANTSSKSASRALPITITNRLPETSPNEDTRMKTLQKGDSLTAANKEFTNEREVASEREIVPKEIQAGNWEIGPDPSETEETADDGVRLGPRVGPAVSAPLPLPRSPLAEDQYLCIQNCLNGGAAEIEDVASSLVRDATDSSETQPLSTQQTSFKYAVPDGSHGAFPEARISDAFIEQEVYRGDTFEDEIDDAVGQLGLEHVTLSPQTSQILLSQADNVDAHQRVV